MEKKATRLRRATRARKKIRELGACRLCVHRTPRHGSVLASASTLQPDLRKELGKTGNVAAATRVGQLVAERAKAAGPGSSTTAGSRPWPTQRARAGWNSDKG
jgi:large subunit ribosomal protein L18